MSKQLAVESEKQSILAPAHLGVKAVLTQAFRKVMAAPTGESKGFWIKGSGSVYIPKSRANEIPKVLEEHRTQEYNRVMLLTYLRRTL